jgi:hypothetical protein
MKTTDHHIQKSKKRKKPLIGTQLLKKQQTQIISYQIFNDIFLALGAREYNLKQVMDKHKESDSYMQVAGYRGLIDGIHIAINDIDKIRRDWRRRYE